MFGSCEKPSAEESELWAILWKYPVYETGITLYSTVMNPAQGSFTCGWKVDMSSLRHFGGCCFVQGGYHDIHLARIACRPAHVPPRAPGLFRSLSEPPEEFQEVKPRAGRKKSRK